MIEEIRIKNLGVIEEATLACDSGFTVITGETGAGKTMLISAVNLLTGARADSGAVRHGAQRAEVEATFVLGDTEAAGQAKATAVEAGAILEDMPASRQELLVSRSVNADGRSKAYAGGRTVPVSLLGALGEKLVTLHGQNDQIRLKSESKQREALDAFGGSQVAQAKEAYQGIYREYANVRKRLERAQGRQLENNREKAYLEAGLTALEKVSPQQGEEEKLRHEAVKLSALEEIQRAVSTAHQALASEEHEATNAVTLSVQAAKALETVADVDGDLSELHERLSEVSYTLSDIVTELSQYLASLDEDAPSRLEQVEQRRAELAKLVRDYAENPGDGLDEVIAWGREAARKLSELTSDSQDPRQLSEQEELLKAKLGEAAQRMSQARRAAAADLSKRVTQELGFLAMEHARFVVDVSPMETPQLHGADKVGFLLAPHPGAALRPVEKGASGGELSRVMLALEVSLAQVAPSDTFIFDEVDTGIGGKTAVEIGKRLALLARQTQVLAVTHSPQIAAFATRQIRIFKDSATVEPAGTVSEVRTLTEQERVTEIARMLAGRASSDTAQAHALELLHEANSLYPPNA